MSDTPRTDALAHQWKNQPVTKRETGEIYNLCSQLERELAELRKVNITADELHRINNLAERAVNAERELAECRAENKKLREYAEGLSQGWSEAEGGRVATFYGRLKHKEKEEGDNE